MPWRLTFVSPECDSDRCTANSATAIPASINVSSIVAVSPLSAACKVTATTAPESRSPACLALWAKCVFATHKSSGRSRCCRLPIAMNKAYKLSLWIPKTKCSTDQDLHHGLSGELNIRTLDGEIVERTLRFGNNEMEKLTLPIPERYGYECYDGKILTFMREGNEVALEAFE